MHGNFLVEVGVIITLAIGAQWLAWRLKLPSILFLLLFGFVAGPISGFLHPDELLGDALFPLVSMAVGIILFEGGLTLHLSELPKIGPTTIRLITIGAILTWILAGWGASAILDLNLTLAILLGAILIVTGPTVVTPLLRQVRPKARIGALLKWEGILIDPVGAVIAVLVFEAILNGELAHIDQAGTSIFLGILRTIVAGGGLGILAALFLTQVLRRNWLPDYLQNGVTLMFVVGVFALSNNLQTESGLLATTVMGAVLANQKYVRVDRIVEFTEDLQILLIGALFILLSARVPIANLINATSWQGILYLAFLIVIARPLTVFLSSAFSELTWKERVFASLMAPRGIVAASVASIFAFDLAQLGYENAEFLASMTFLVIVGTVIFYGLTSGPIARALGLTEENPQGILFIGADPLGRTLAAAVKAQGFRVLLVDTNPRHIRSARQAELETYYGNALSEQTSTDLDLSGIGRLLAITSNSEVNSLASIHFSDEFSRSEVYQLPVTQKRDGETTATTLRGRILFDEKLVFNELAKHLDHGAEIKPLAIPEGFDYEQFRLDFDDLVFPLFLVTEQGEMQVITTDEPVAPSPGQILISLYLPGSEAVTPSYLTAEEETIVAVDESVS